MRTRLPSLMPIRKNIAEAAVLCLIVSSSNAATAASIELDLTSLGAGPQNGTLFSGNDAVDWAVDNSRRGWFVSNVSPNPSYYFYRPNEDGTQTWMFSKPVDLEFTVRGLNLGDEGLKFTVGTVCDTSGQPNFVWDEDEITLQHSSATINSDGLVAIPCTLQNTTELTLDGRNLGSGSGSRGLSSLKITSRAAAAIPTLGQWNLMMLAALLGIIALLTRRKRRLP